eukprot:Blabericola_migrator_1__5299@NODE_271_length_10510_cov_106_175333_g226_i0_p8_GENE_NODE_271_length_10510_cov_106_175333_g226_i0NODE_271_length_10510_cov_106_175333_g226_i0_p8_ORF_typecomplete_len138_score13_45DUF5058/PF16481_5/0_075MBOAT/PF03062_19/0_049MBOAT/PF03062_19/1_3e03_NODE_271_length_10510_cov_106_175333_g226_i0258671
MLIFLFVALWHRINTDFLWWAVITIGTVIIELNFERLGGHSFNRKIFRASTGLQYTALVMGTVFINVLVIVANLVGFACGESGILHLVNEIMSRPGESITAILFFVMFGFLHSSYLIERDANPSAVRTTSSMKAHSN